MRQTWHPNVFFWPRDRLGHRQYLTNGTLLRLVLPRQMRTEGDSETLSIYLCSYTLSLSPQRYGYVSSVSVNSWSKGLTLDVECAS